MSPPNPRDKVVPIGIPVGGTRNIIVDRKSSSAIARVDASESIKESPHTKWPVWARMIVIIGSAALLWAGIISGILVLIP